MGDLRDSLFSSHEAGTFIQDVYTHSLAERDQIDVLAAELSSLHNEGAIDVVAQFALLRNDPDSGVDFFLTRHIFEKVLPNINAPVASVMACVNKLHTEAGNDMAAGMIFDAYGSYCSNDHSRPREALAKIERDHEFVNLLTPTIIAGTRIDHAHYVGEAARLSATKDIEIRRRAVFALGRIKWQEDAMPPESVYVALGKVVAEESDDELLGCAIKALFNLLQCDKSKAGHIKTLINDALSKGGDFVIHAASELFGFHTKELTTPILNVLLPFLLRVKPSNKGTLDNIDYGLSHLLKLGDCEKTISFLEEILLEHAGELSIDVFDSVLSDLRKDQALMGKLATKWLLLGESVLCESICTLVGARYGANLLLEADPSELKPPDGVHIIFVARKAIGYLFFNPVSAVSMIISLMRHTGDDDVLAELGLHLLDPLLLNYTGKAREYVAECAAKELPGKVREQLNSVLKALEEYLEKLRSIDDIPELRPSQAHREAYNRRFGRQMAESLKKAEDKSVLLNLVTRMVLLYGRRSINYVYGADGEPTRTETPLKEHSVEMEFPRAERLDPFGLDYMLRVFRAEQVRA